MSCPLHASLTDETCALIGEKALRAMKPTAILVNTARGEIADEEAIARALTEGLDRGRRARRLHAGATARLEPAARRGSGPADPHAPQREP